MAISAALVTGMEGESTTDASVYVTTNSFTPASNTLYLLSVSSGKTGAVDVPTVTGAGVTWVEIASVQNQNHRTTVFRAMGPGTNGQLTITHGAQQGNCAWRVVSFTGIDTSGTNGSGAVGQFNTATGTGSPATVTLGSLTAGSSTFGAQNQNSTSGVVTAGSGFTLIGSPDNTDPGTPSTQLANEWSSTGTNPVTFSVGAVEWGIVGVEVKEAATLAAKAGTETLAVSLTEASTVTSGRAVAESAYFILDPFGGFEQGFASGENATITVAITASDTLALSLTESRTVLSALARSESLLLTISESQSSMSALSRADSLTLTATETSAVTAGNARADTLALTVTDASSITSALARSDNLLLSITDASSNMSALGRADNLAVSITDTSAHLSALARTDTLALTLTEATSETTISVARADSLLISLTEAASVQDSIVPKASSDSLSLSVTDVSTNASGLSRTDNLSLTLTDASAVTAGNARTDSLALSITDVSSNVSALSRSDSLALTLTEASAITAGHTRTDTLSVVLQEASQTAIFLARSDTLLVSLTDAATTFKMKVLFLEPTPYSVLLNNPLVSLEVVAHETVVDIVPSRYSVQLNDPASGVVLLTNGMQDAEVAASAATVVMNIGAVSLFMADMTWEQPAFLIIEGGQDSLYFMHTRLAALGFTNVVANLNAATLSDLDGYDVIISDRTAWGVSKTSLLTSAYQAGKGIISSGNDSTVNSTPQITAVAAASKGSANPPYRLEPTGVHPVRTGVTANEDRETDTGQLPTALRETAIPIATMPWGAANLLTVAQARMDDILGWTAGNNSSISRSTGVAQSYSTGVLSITSVAAGNSAAYMTYANSVACNPGDQITGHGEFRAATLGRSVGVELRFYTSADGSSFTDVPGSFGFNSTTQWLHRFVTATAPAGTLRVGIIFRVTGNGAASEVHHVQKAGINVGPIRGFVLPGASPTTWTGITSFVEEDPAGSRGRWLHLHPYSSSGTFTTGTTYMQLLKRGASWARPTIKIASVDLTAVGDLEASVVTWNQTTPGESSVTVESSLDGTNWSAVTNGGAIPGLTPGQAVSGVVVQFRVTLATYDPAVLPTVTNFIVMALSAEVAASAGRLGMTVDEDSKVTVEVN